MDTSLMIDADARCYHACYIPGTEWFERWYVPSVPFCWVLWRPITLQWSDITDRYSAFWRSYFANNPPPQ